MSLLLHLCHPKQQQQRQQQQQQQMMCTVSIWSHSVLILCALVPMDKTSKLKRTEDVARKVAGSC